MKKDHTKARMLLAFIMLILAFTPLHAQLGVGTATPDASSQLDVVSTTRGALLPRMTSAQMNAISDPALGLLVYCIDCTPAGLYHNNGSGYVAITDLNYQNSNFSPDNLGHHTATQNINLSDKKLVGDTGTIGITITRDGKVGIATKTTPLSRLFIDSVTTNIAGLQIGRNLDVEESNTQILAGIGPGDRAFRLIAAQPDTGYYINMLTHNMNYTGTQYIQGNWGGSSSIVFSGGDITINNDSQINGGTNDDITPTTTMSLSEANYVRLSSGSWVNAFTNDATLGGNNDSLVPTASAVKAYIDNSGGLIMDTDTTQNIHGGQLNLRNLSTGTHNLALGYQALDSITTGTTNVAAGSFAGLNTSTGSRNTYLGGSAGRLNITGNKNVAIGDSALHSNTSGSSNVAIGAGAGKSNSTGVSNVYLGHAAGHNSTTNDNVMIGQQAGFKSRSQSSVYLGYQAGFNDTTGTNSQRLFIENSDANIPLFGGDFVKNKVGINMHIDSLNKDNRATLQIGGDMQLQNGAKVNEFSVATDLGGVSASDNVVSTQKAVKAYVDNNVKPFSTRVDLAGAGASDDSVATQKAVKAYVDNNSNGFLTSETDDQVIDLFQLNNFTLELSLESDAQPTKTVDLGGIVKPFSTRGDLAGANASDDSVATQKAVKAYVDNSGGLIMDNATNRNIHGGQLNLRNLSTGINNLALGYEALDLVTTGSVNVAVGPFAGMKTTIGARNTFLGAHAGRLNISGNNNVAIGDSALQSNTSGSSNVAIGARAGKSNTSGASNVYLGNGAGQKSTTNNNVMIGHQAGFNSTSQSSVYLGYQAGFNDTTIANTQRLYINNSNTNSPLIGGDFAKNKVGINMPIDSLNRDNRASFQVGGDMQFMNGTNVNEFSTDGTMLGNSDNAVPTEKAVKQYVDGSRANLKTVFNYNPSDQDSVYEQYLGNFSTSSGPIEVKVGDEGNSHFGGAYIRAMRPYNAAPVVTYQERGSGGEYRLAYRIIDFTEFELFLVNASPANNDVNHRVEVYCPHAYSYDSSAVVKNNRNIDTAAVRHYVDVRQGLEGSSIGTYSTGATLNVNGTLKLEQGKAVKEFSTDSLLAGNSREVVPTEQAVKMYVDSVSKPFSTRTDLAGTGASDDSVATQKAVKTYVDNNTKPFSTRVDLAGAGASDDSVATQKAVKAYVDNNTKPFSTRVDLAGANASDDSVATQKAVKAYVDSNTRKITFTGAATYNITNTDYVVNANGSSDQDLYLPDASGVRGKVIVIKNTHTSSKTVDVFRLLNSAQHIDGASRVSLHQYDSLTVQSDGSNWIIIGRYDSSSF